MSDHSIRVGDFVDISFLSQPDDKRYVVWLLYSPPPTSSSHPHLEMKLYNIVDYKDQLSLYYIDNMWNTIDTDDKMKIKLVSNTILDELDISNVRLLDVVLSSPFQYAWDCRFLSKNPNINFQDILENPDFWNYSYLSSNPNITLNDVLSYPELEWDYHVLTSNPNISLYDILSHPELEWDYNRLTENPNVTFPVIRVL